MRCKKIFSAVFFACFRTLANMRYRRYITRSARNGYHWKRQVSDETCLFLGMNCYNGLREESSMKSFALLTMKSETSFRRNLQPTASDEIKSVKLPTKSDFITKWFHPRKWIYSVRMTDLIEKSTAVAMLFSGMNNYNGLPKTYFSRHHHTHSFHTKSTSS